MSAKQLQLKIITPERLIIDEMVDIVTIPTTDGEMGILKDHIPLVTGLASGDIVAEVDGEHVPFAVSGGFVEVKRLEDGGTQVAILAEFAEHVSEISDQAIIEAKLRAEELKKQSENKEIVDFEHFASELERSLTRVKIADKWKTKKYRK